MAYADIADMAAVSESSIQDGDSKAEYLLEMASTILDSEFDRAGVDVDKKSPTWWDALRYVCANMAARSYDAGKAAGVDATQMTITAGSYSQSWSNASGIATMRPTADERRMLGIERRRGRIGFAELGGRHD